MEEFLSSGTAKNRISKERASTYSIPVRYRLLILLWLLTDLAVFTLAYTLAYFLRVGFVLSTDFPFNPYLTTTIIAAFIWLGVLLSTRTFTLTRSQRAFKTFTYLAYAALVGSAAFALAFYFLYGLFFSRLLLVYAFGLSLLCSWIWHVLYGSVLRVALRKDPAVFPTLIIGVTRESERLIALLNERKHPLKPVAILDGTGVKEKDIHGVPVVGKLNKLESTLEEQKITHLIQCSDLEQSLNLLGACRTRGITYLLLPSVLGIVERDERLESLEGRPVTMVSPRRGVWGWLFE
jgi:FlaA1/EpsC-like NDP-sugar epimerase